MMTPSESSNPALPAPDPALSQTEEPMPASWLFRFLEVCGAFLKLGLMSFGGPVAHLGYFRAEFIHKRRWLDDAAFSDLVALCNFLPGPASSQTVFGIGMQRAGLLGGLASSLCFMLPSAILMILFGYGVSTLGDLSGAGWLHGLKLAAVAVVAQAVWGMGRNLCPDRPRLTLCLLAAGLILVFPGAFAQIGAIAGGGLIGWWLYRAEVHPVDSAEKALIRGHIPAILSILTYFLLLILGPVAASATGTKAVAMFDGFYRAGALVFGGGHVVLPLLRAEVVPQGWITDSAFLAGYGAAQAVPGPLFTFAGYLGTVIQGGPQAWQGGVLCLTAIFLPGWLLISGALPFWHSLRTKAWAQAALRGTNAAVVGVLLAALYDPVCTAGIKAPRDVAAALVAFGLLQFWKIPPWAIVILAAAAGQWVLK